MDCQSLDGLPSGMALPCRLSSEGRRRRKLTRGTSVPPKTISEKIVNVGKKDRDEELEIS